MKTLSPNGPPQAGPIPYRSEFSISPVGPGGLAGPGQVLDKLGRRLVSGVLRVPGAIPLARSCRAGSFAIVMYHGVTSKPLEVPNWCQLDAAEFGRQIEYLARAYTIVPLGEAVGRIRRGKRLPKRTVCITFDDGFRNVLTTAYPILNRHGAPATVFLVTGLIGTRQPAWPDVLFHDVARTRRESLVFHDREFSLRTNLERADVASVLSQTLKDLPDPEREERLQELRAMLGPSEVEADSPQATLNWNEIEELSRTGLIDFGTHTHLHPILARCSRGRQYEEIRTSCAIVRERLGRCDLFAYPNGRAEDFTAETKEILRELGFLCGVSTREGLNRIGADLMDLKRVAVGYDTLGSSFRLRMLGV